jgi:hypothetical protein
MLERTSRHVVVPFLVLAAVYGWSGCVEKQPVDTNADKTSRTLEDVIPLTVANLRGHQMLYNEGWFIITSSRKALEYAQAKSIAASDEAIRAVQQRFMSHSVEYTESLNAGVQQSLDAGKKRLQTGTEQSGRILQHTGALAQSELAYARANLVNAWEQFIQGHLTLAKRTEEDRIALAGLPGGWFNSLHSDFSNIRQLTGSLREQLAGRIEVSWDAAFAHAGKEFREEYERSGRQSNTLIALGPLLQGYLKALYHGAAVPTAKTLVHAGATGTAHVSGSVFLPVAGASVVLGRTIQAVGLTVFYAGKTGVNLISPTVESGLLSGMAVLSLGAVPLTYVTGGTLGAINQVAFTAGAPVYTAGESAIRSAAQTGRYVGFVAYDVTTSVTSVVINQAASGVVLGYNALSAIPAHLLMGIADAAILLAWEGPNLVIAKVTGRLTTKQELHRPSESTPGDLPVGTVIDIRKLQEAEGVQVEILSRDPAVIRDVIPQIPCDVRDGDETCQHD